VYLKKEYIAKNFSTYVKVFLDKNKAQCYVQMPFYSWFMRKVNHL